MTKSRANFWCMLLKNWCKMTLLRCNAEVPNTWGKSKASDP